MNLPGLGSGSHIKFCSKGSYDRSRFSGAQVMNDISPVTAVPEQITVLIWIWGDTWNESTPLLQIFSF